MKVGFISLGCSKNLVVTENVIGLFKKHGYEIESDPSLADMLVINTCGFIESAKEEAIDTILEMAEYKKQKCKYLIVMGCLVERYEEELKRELPEVDLFLSIHNYRELWARIQKLQRKEEEDVLSYKNRVLTTGPVTAYLKIAEGCSNFCTYCAIPYIQGKYISRDYEEILEEARMLKMQGIEELVVIAQDTSKYGLDLYGRNRLAELLQDLSDMGFTWIRTLYAYPETITDELIEVVKKNKNIVPYFDIPIQHISDSVLKKMNRKSDGDSIKKLIQKLRQEIPNVIIRSTLIVGFPGETESDFQELQDFVKNYKMDRLGAFAYSKEDHTPAASFPNQIDEKVKIERRDKIMALQQEVSKENLKTKIGKEYLCLIEDMTEDGEYFIGRTYMDVPSEDGVVYVKYSSDIALYTFVPIVITDTMEYDFVGEIVKEKVSL